MFISRWVIAVAFGLTLVTSGQAQENIDQPEPHPDTTQTQPTEQAGISPEDASPSIAAPTGPPSQEHDETGPTDGNKEAEEIPDIILGDGWAQWAMVIIALIGVAISGWAVWLLKRTLDATIVAIGEGKKATDASLDAVKAASAANEIMLLEQRPWITLEKEFECNFHDRGGFQGEIVWNYNFVNKGKTPAYSVQKHGKVVKGIGVIGTLSSIDLLEFVDQCVAKRSDRWGVPIIFAGESSNFGRFSQYEMNSYERMKSVVEGDSFIYICCVSYRLGLGKDSEIGVEARLFIIEENERFLGPWGNVLREYSQIRIVR